MLIARSRLEKGAQCTRHLQYFTGSCDACTEIYRHNGFHSHESTNLNLAKKPGSMFTPDPGPLGTLTTPRSL